jgi:hypothetical protein
MTRRPPVLYPCCRYLWWTLGTAHGDLNRAAKQAARWNNQRAFDAVNEAKAELAKAKQVFQQHYETNHPTYEGNPDDH